MQTTSNIMMVRPAAFQFNEETALTNDYQKKINYLTQQEILEKAQREFDNFVNILKNNDVNVIVIQDTNEPVKPDAIFPNNWITTHSDGRVFLFPMKTHNRRLEVRQEIINILKDKFVIREIVDLRNYEKADRALEGTGSIVFDHEYRLAYTCLSPRTDEKILNEYCSSIGYKPVVFEAYKTNGQPQYHTNVVMCVGNKFVLICLECIKEGKQQEHIRKIITNSKKNLIEIDCEQLEKNYAGNLLQIQNKKGDSFLVMSKRALGSLNQNQLTKLKNYSTILAPDIDLIEEIGGGSARCMMAEIFLKEK